jgi:hypothetical protein
MQQPRALDPEDLAKQIVTHILVVPMNSFSGNPSRSGTGVELCGAVSAGISNDRWQKKLDDLSGLRDNWNRYSSPAPSEAAVQVARLFLQVLAEEGRQPTRVAPSAVGGVGVTLRRGDRMAYVEFYNNGTAHALLTDEDSEGETIAVEPKREGYKRLLRRMDA